MLPALSNNSYVLSWEDLLIISDRSIILPVHGLVLCMSVHLQDVE